MPSRLLLSAALIVAAASCGAEQPSSQAPPASPPVIAARPSADDGAPYQPWTETRELACAHMRDEIAEGRLNAEGPPSERPYDPDYLPGFAAPAFTRADAALVRRLFGQPCEGVERVWAAPISAFDTSDEQASGDFALVMRPVMLRLPDGRDVLLAPVMPGDAHATIGFNAAYIIGAQQERLFAMSGGGTFGALGRLSVPLHQPLGAFHVWLEGGGTWQGHTQGWAGVTDFSGASPRNRGSFLTYGDIPCDRAAQEDSRDALCHGATTYALTSVDYSDNGADELTLMWTLETYDQASGDRRVNRRTRTLTARYELLGGAYRLAEGEEPPRI